MAIRFNGFEVDLEKRLLLKQGAAVELSARAFDILIVLLTHSGKTISKEYLVEAVWRDSHVSESIITVYITALRKALGDSKKLSKYILTVPGEGYRFIEKVENSCASPPLVEEQQTSADQPSPVSNLLPPLEGVQTFIAVDDENPNRTAVKERETQSPRLWGGKIRFVLASSLIYALLYSISLIAEIAYQFNEYGASAIRLSVVVFMFIFFTSLYALYADWKRVMQDKTDGLVVSCLIFILAATGLIWGVSSFLPAHPVTEIQPPNITAQTAQAAYLKDITYHLVVVLVFLAMPYHFILVCFKKIQEGQYRVIFTVLFSSAKAVLPRGTLYLRVWFLGGLLLLFAAYSLFAHPHLLDKLMPGHYMNLFMILLQIRLFFFYTLIVSCLAWYYISLNEVKRLCLEEDAYDSSVSMPPRGSSSPSAQSQLAVATHPSMMKLWQHPLVVLIMVALPILTVVRYMFAIKPRPQITRVEILAPAIHKQEFFIRVEGKGITPNLVQAVVIGPHCPRFDNCVVPNNVLMGVSRNIIERLPLTLDAGRFDIYLRNGNDGEISEPYSLEVELQ